MTADLRVRRVIGLVVGLVIGLLITLPAGADARGEAAAGQGIEPSPSPTAQPLGPAPVLVIIDASGSMNADDGSGRPKIEAARSALLQLIEEFGSDAEVGLRAYGHRTPNTDRAAGCADTELLVPVAAGNAAALREAVDRLSASGYTPIGTSLRAATDDLPRREGRTVVLISDGIDTCAPPAACEVAQELVADRIELRVEAIGFRVDDAAADDLRCIAEVTGGTYRPADDADDLARELRANIPTGVPVEGGPTPAQATVVGPGQYVDLLAYPEQRWYAVELETGDRVRATATLIGDEQTPAVPAARAELVLSFADVIGSTPCAVDAAQGVRPTTINLAVDGLEVEGGTVCSDPGTYTVGVRIVPPDGVTGALPLADLTMPLELFLAVTSATVLDDVTPQSETPRPAAAVAVAPPRRPTPTPLYLLTISGFGMLGAIIGVGVSRRMGS